MFYKKYKFPPILDFIYQRIKSVNSISDLIRFCYDFFKEINKIKDYSEKDKKSTEGFINFFRKRQELVKGMISFQLEIPLEELNLEQLNHRFFYTSKTNIAEEFGINKRTLNKWLEIVGLNSKYNGRKQINFKEYKEIFTAFFTAKDEGLNISENIEAYKLRLEKGMKFWKRDLFDYAGSDYKEQRNILDEVKYYDFTNLFPYSIAKILVEKLGYDLSEYL